MAADGTDLVDELFALAPEGFTAARDALARRLRSEGDREAATAVKALRRPTAAAWALNQVVRQHRDEVEALVHAGEALAEAQQEALAGSPAASLGAKAAASLADDKEAASTAATRAAGAAEAQCGNER